MTVKMRKVTQDEWAEHLNLQSCYACEPSPDVMEHRVWGTAEVVGRVIYTDTNHREYFIPMDAITMLMSINERLTPDMAYRYSVRHNDVFNMQVVLRAWGYPFCEEAAQYQLDHARKVWLDTDPI